MSLAKKLRDVVAANFIEIARSDGPEGSTAEQRGGAFPGGSATPAPPPADPLGLDAAAERARVEAESEIDSLLSPLPPAPEPEPEPEPEPVLPRLLDAVAADGAVDFERIYTHLGHKLPPFTAEQAMNMLTSMPRDLPLKVKRVTVRATLDAIGSVVGATPKDIVADATAKRAFLETYAADMESEADSEVERLQAEIAERQAALKDTQRKRQNALDAVRGRLDVLDQVTAFFDYDEGAEAAVPADSEEDEAQPAFLDEGAVLRMLGLAAQEAEAREAAVSGQDGEEAAGAAEPAAAAGRRGGRRAA